MSKKKKTAKRRAAKAEKRAKPTKAAKRDAKSTASSAQTPASGRRRVVVTAGPTREHVDPVRYLSNESSGRMGFEIARAAAAKGWDVVLIAGPVALATPDGVRRIDVVSALDMLTALQGEFDACDALFMAAAVSDWRPSRRLSGKWRAKDTDDQRTTIELVRNPDLLATVTGAASDSRHRPVRKGARLVVGFALETAGGPRRARAKLHRKGADYVVLNDPSALGADTTRVTLFARDGSEQALTGTKTAVARALVDLPKLG